MRLLHKWLQETGEGDYIPNWVYHSRGGSSGGNGGGGGVSGGGCEGDGDGWKDWDSVWSADSDFNLGDGWDD